jgi:hypothetical protein
VPNLELTCDGARAHLRFLTEHDDVYWGEFHAVRKTLGRERYLAWHVCERETGRCWLCECEYRRQKQLLLWAFVYRQLCPHRHWSQGWGEIFAPDGERLFGQTVNDVRLFRCPLAHGEDLVAARHRYHTLLDRDYEWVRHGRRGDRGTTYSLRPLGDPGALPLELAALSLELPSLDDERVLRPLPEPPYVNPKDEIPF